MLPLLWVTARQLRKALLEGNMATMNNLNGSIATTPHPPPALSAARWPQIVLFGDSLTQYSFGTEGCWGALLAEAVARKCDVINRGFSGYNSRWNRIMLPRVIPAEMAAQVHLVTIFLGANDSTDPEMYDPQQTEPLQTIALEEFKTNLVVMVEYLMAVGIKREHIMLIDNPPSDDEKWNTYCRENKGRDGTKNNKLSKMYADACVQTAENLNVGHVNLYEHMTEHSDWRDMFHDGLHFSQKGGEFVFSLLRPWVEEHTRDLPEIFPQWRDVDYKDPTKSLGPEVL